MGGARDAFSLQARSTLEPSQQPLAAVRSERDYVLGGEEQRLICTEAPGSHARRGSRKTGSS